MGQAILISRRNFSVKTEELKLFHDGITEEVPPFWLTSLGRALAGAGQIDVFDLDRAGNLRADTAGDQTQCAEVVTVALD